MKTYTEISLNSKAFVFWWFGFLLSRPNCVILTYREVLQLKSYLQMSGVAKRTGGEELAGLGQLEYSLTQSVLAGHEMAASEN